MLSRSARCTAIVCILVVTLACTESPDPEPSDDGRSDDGPAEETPSPEPDQVFDIRHVEPVRMELDTPDEERISADVRIATSAGDARTAWDELSMDGEPSSFDESDEVLLIVRLLGGMGCPNDDITDISEVEPDVWEVTVEVTDPVSRTVDCPGPPTPQSVVATLARESLPDEPFTLRLPEDPPDQDAVERTFSPDQEF